MKIIMELEDCNGNKLQTIENYNENIIFGSDLPFGYDTELLTFVMFKKSNYMVITYTKKESKCVQKKNSSGKK